MPTTLAGIADQETDRVARILDRLQTPHPTNRPRRRKRRYRCEDPVIRPAEHRPAVSAFEHGAFGQARFAAARTALSPSQLDGRGRRSP